MQKGLQQGGWVPVCSHFALSIASFAHLPSRKESLNPQLLSYFIDKAAQNVLRAPYKLSLADFCPSFGLEQPLGLSVG